MDLVFVGDLGFSMASRDLKRASIDYWELTRVKYVRDQATYLARLDMSRTYLLSSKVERSYTEIKPQPGDTFLFGSETAGLPAWIMNRHPEACFTIPMPNKGVRCLNLATSVGIVMYQMLAQYNFGLASSVLDDVDPPR